MAPAAHPVPGHRRVEPGLVLRTEVLAARRDHVRLNGIDPWVGGVHLAGRSTPWRYDERLETLLTPAG